MSPLTKRFILVAMLVALEFAAILWFKDGIGSYLRDSQQTIVGYLKINGGLEFFAASYIQKIVYTASIGYFFTIAMILVKERRNSSFMRNLDQFGYRPLIVWVNLTSFLYLSVLFIAVKRPEPLVENPFAAQSILYAGSPIVWCLFLYSVFNLAFPFTSLIRFATRKLLLQAAGVFAIVTISILISRDVMIDYWAGLLLPSTLVLSTALCHLVGFDAANVISNPSGMPIFGTNVFQVLILPGCSGYEGMTLIMIILAAYCVFQRGMLRIPRAFLIIPLAAISMFLLNAIRISALVAIGHYWSPAVAMNGFHAAAGWINLVIVLLFALLLLHNLPFFLKTPLSKNEYPALTKGGWDEVVLLFPLLALIGSSLFIKALTADFSWLYPIPILLALGTLYYFRTYFRFILDRPSVISIFIGIAVFILWINMIAVDEFRSQQFLMQLKSAPPVLVDTWLIFRGLVGASLVVPIVEELAFRGLIQSQIQELLNRFQLQNFSAEIALIISAILFGVLHSDFLAGTMAGLFFGLAYMQRRKIVDAIVAHAITNALLAIYIVYFGYWSYW